MERKRRKNIAKFSGHYVRPRMPMCVRKHYVHTNYSLSCPKTLPKSHPKLQDTIWLSMSNLISAQNLSSHIRTEHQKLGRYILYRRGESWHFSWCLWDFKCSITLVIDSCSSSSVTHYFICVWLVQDSYTHVGRTKFLVSLCSLLLTIFLRFCTHILNF